PRRALVPEAPQLARAVPHVEKELSEVVDVAERIAGGRERRVVVAVQEDDRHPLDVALAAAEADDRDAEGGVDDPREIGGERRADEPVRLRAPRAGGAAREAEQAERSSHLQSHRCSSCCPRTIKSTTCCASARSV